MKALSENSGTKLELCKIVKERQGWLQEELRTIKNRDRKLCGRETKELHTDETGSTANNAIYILDLTWQNTSEHRKSLWGQRRHTKNLTKEKLLT